jgi:tRNA pseudouridine55 synthase
LDGLLNINKPAGTTSYGVVARVKRWSGERRVGHAGTLDPDATGVLPVCLGQATRVVAFLVDTAKTYRAEVELGVTTDTFDASGNIISRGDPSGATLTRINEVLVSFRGPIRQTPPMFSALKHRGRPLYKLARAGVSIDRRSRPVTIYRLDLVSWRPPDAILEIECSKGTYIRSLAHDLGQFLGCGAYLKGLVRTRSGIFDIKDAVTMAELEEAFRRGDWQRFLRPIDSILEHLPAVFIERVDEAAIKNGSSIALAANLDTEKSLRAYSQDGRFLAILRYLPELDLWHPEKVFMSTGSEAK